MNPKGTLYIIAAASGTGKTSLSNALATMVENIRISTSYTTRAIRAGEVANKNYFFVVSTNRTKSPLKRFTSTKPLTPSICAFSVNCQINQ